MMKTHLPHLKTHFIVVALILTTLLSLAVTSTTFASSSSQSDSPSTMSIFDYKVLSGQRTVAGTQQALIVLVEFQDVSHTRSAEQVKAVAVDELNAYYSEVSYGKVSISGQVYGWYRLDRPIGYYGHDSRDPGDDDNLQELATAAVAFMPSTVNPTVLNFLVI